ncbi:MAG: radical SAM protein, partial [Candidatus Omnitrophota bacterium]|nr:radical SAM protein [Candidatus Omnitrophota bacterium]
MIKSTRLYLFLNVIICIIIISIIAVYPPPQTISGAIPVDGTRIKQAEWEVRDCLGVLCTLCPFRCFLPEGSRGICRVRMNVGGRLKTLVYAQPVSVHIAPIEKK